MEIKDLHHLYLKCTSVSTDTRKIEKNSMFVALKGDRFDANTFAKEALKKGASYVIIDNKDYYVDERTVLVKDSLKTLQDLAKFHRSYLKLPIIALTGSNGKTTTKELIHVVLLKKYTTKATVGNLNNHIGVPLTLLSFSQSTAIGIVEMGANHQKEIEFLCDLAQPDFGYITNFGKAHLEGFGGTEGVIKGKSEMYDYLLSNNKLAFVNLEDPIQVAKTAHIQRITFGLNDENANTNILKIRANPLVKIDFEDTVIQSNLIGLYNANNINAALAIGKYFNVATADIKSAIEGYSPDNNRSQLLNKNGNDIILDAYNANPSSMKVAIDNFMQLEKPNKIAFLGDMFELGAESRTEHEEIIRQISNFDQVEWHLIGHDFYANKIQKANLHFHKDFESIALFLKETKLNGRLLLIKGSRGMALERTLDLL